MCRDHLFAGCIDLEIRVGNIQLSTAQPEENNFQSKYNPERDNSYQDSLFAWK
jgi:hypothetical protein